MLSSDSTECILPLLLFCSTPVLKTIQGHQVAPCLPTSIKRERKRKRETLTFTSPVQQLFILWQRLKRSSWRFEKFPWLQISVSQTWVFWMCYMWVDCICFKKSQSYNPNPSCFSPRLFCRCQNSISKNNWQCKISHHSDVLKPKRSSLCLELFTGQKSDAGLQINSILALEGLTTIHCGRLNPLNS